MADIDLTPQFKQQMVSRPRTRGRYSASELYFMLHGTGKYKTTPEKWLHPPERTVEENLRMWNGTWTHNKIQSLLIPDYCENKREFVYRDIVLVGKADYLSPDKEEVWEFKTSEKLMTEMKPWHGHQTKLYCTMFDRPIGAVYQPVQNADGIYLKEIGRVERDDTWMEKELELLYAYHLELEKL